MASSSSSTQVQSASSTELRLGSSSDEYNSWKDAMLYILESTNLVGFINGELPPPPETSTQAHKDWKRNDQTIKTWIVDSLSDELCPSVIAFKTSRDVWLQLEDIFTPPPPPPPPFLRQGEPEHNNYKQMPLALYKAALRGDWDATKAILEQDPDVAEATVAPNLDTVLHIAVGTGQAIPYLQNLVDYMTGDSLAVKNIRGYTALCMAAQMGNLPAATIMVEKRPDLLYVPDNLGIYPVAKAAMSGNRPTIEFFISHTKDDLDDFSPYAHDNGILLLINLIDTDFFDIAMDLIDKYPDLAQRKHTTSGRSVLRSIAMKPAAFESGARFNSWERLIYSEFGRWHRHVWNLHTSLCQVLIKLVPRAKWIRDQKMKHEQAVKLVECLCERLEFINEDEATSIYAGPIIRAAELGIHEVLEIIVDKFPVAIYSAEPFNQRYLFHIAVENRCEKVFNLIYQMSDHKYRFSNLVDLSGSSMLHMVARLAPPHKLNLVSGAALQMQRELQWFKEVEKFLEPYDRENPNFEGTTPQMIFTEEHSSLKVEGEKWMKDTANSCSIAAALIATVVFAAAITVPGGNADTGYPLFVESSAFIIFAVSDAISLFTSSTSLLMFLSILTSRYAEEDFLHALPKRLCVGLFTLFLSILFMTAAFSATIFVVFAKKSGWVLIPVAALACMPVASFVLLQFPLLVDVISSTYGHGIFAGYKRMPLTLYKAALRGDWDTTKAILEQDPDAAEARMAPNSDTPLHIAVRTGQAIPYLRNLLNYVTDDSLALKNDSSGSTALNVAALQGNLAAARILVERRRDLLYVPDTWGVFPIVKAAMSAHRPTIDFFMSETKDDEGTNPYADDYGVLLLNTLISSDFFDIALCLIDKYPNLAKRKHASGHSALRTIALNDAAFASGAHFSFWERLIYNSIPLEMELEQVAADIENPSCCALIPRGFGRWLRVGWNLHTALYHVIRLLVPHTEWIHDQKMKHGQALKLVLCLCKHMESLSEEEATSIFADAILKAAEFGIHEVVEAIVDTFPIAVYCSEGSTKRFFFHMAVENRCEKVFNLIYQMSDSKEQFSTFKDYSGETLLHMVARLAPPHKLNLVSGAALQMQRELQWFKEVEKLVKPYDREQPNNDGRTPRMIFTEEHSNLKAEGEKWMKDTANSCSIAAALIATVVFAAAITIPGGNADTGYPLFAKSSAFIIFAISDAISLFTSSTSLLMFLSILTSSYAEEDFLYALPKRLCVGLFTLFLSILFMMAAFSCAIYLVFGRTSGWVLIPVALLACLPVTSFVLLQFPLLLDVISSTYGRGIFGKQSDRPFF